MTEIRKLTVWHNEKHEDYTVTEIVLPPNQSANDWIREGVKLGGFWYEGSIFIPWHQINSIKLDLLTGN